MPTLSLVERVTSFLQRECAWFDELLKELRNLEAELNTGSLETLIDKQAQYEKQIEDFHREQHGLLQEWQHATETPESDRTRIRKKALEAATLRDTVLQWYQKNLPLLEQERDRCRLDLESMKNNRRNLKRFNPGLDTSADYLDRRA